MALTTIGAVILGVLVRLCAAERKMSSACYSTGSCGLHFLSCGPDQTVLLDTLQYGFKNAETYKTQNCASLLNNCDTGVSKEACCRYNVSSDCLRAYSMENQNDFRTKCDGAGQCTIQAAHISGGCNEESSAASSFSVIYYNCEKKYTAVLTSQTGEVEKALQTSVTPEPQEFRGTSLKTSETPTPCDACTTHAPELTQENRQRTGRDDVFQLVVGVSVGVGFGIAALAVIGCVCWIRIRRKPLPAAAATRRQAESRSVSNRTTTTRTLGSLPPPSVLSFPYSSPDTDFAQSSHPESIYSVPTDVMSSASSLDYSLFLNSARGEHVQVSSPKETTPNVMNGVLLLAAGDGITVNGILPLGNQSVDVAPSRKLPTPSRYKTNSVASSSSQTTETWPPEQAAFVTQAQEPIRGVVTRHQNTENIEGPITNINTSSDVRCDQSHSGEGVVHLSPFEADSEKERIILAGNEREDATLYPNLTR